MAVYMSERHLRIFHLGHISEALERCECRYSIKTKLPFSLGLLSSWLSLSLPSRIFNNRYITLRSQDKYPFCGPPNPSPLISSKRETSLSLFSRLQNRLPSNATKFSASYHQAAPLCPSTLLCSTVNDSIFSNIAPYQVIPLLKQMK